MSEDSPKGHADEPTHITITGLNNVHIQTLTAIVRQLHDGARFSRYGKRALTELAQFAKAFETELQRREADAQARLAASRPTGASAAKRGLQS